MLTSFSYKNFENGSQSALQLDLLSEWSKSHGTVRVELNMYLSALAGRLQPQV
jgi:hypothetical protein